MPDLTTLREEIRSALVRSTGRGRRHSIAEAATITVINVCVLYNVRRGINLHVEQYLPALLDLPGFTEEFCRARGYACDYLADGDGCEWEAMEAVTEATGLFGRLLAKAPHRFDASKRAMLADRLRSVVGKCMAVIRRDRQSRIMGEAQ